MKFNNVLLYRNNHTNWGPRQLTTLFVIVINILFAKLPWPGDSKETFQSSSQVATCPVPTCLPHTVEASHCPFNCWTSSREAVNPNFYSLWLDSTGNQTLVYCSVADTLSTRPLIGVSDHKPTDCHRKLIANQLTTDWP